METALFIVAIAVAGLACPAMMWWNNRRGRAASCCAPAGSSGRSPSIEELRRQRDEIAVAIGEPSRSERRSAPVPTRTTN